MLSWSRSSGCPSEAAIRGHKKRLAQAEKRLGELDRLFIRIYEDNVAGASQMKSSL